MASRTFDSEAVAFSHPRVQQLDPLTSLRFFAALYVVVFHYGDSFFDKPLLCVFLPLGYSGVTFFFMLSDSYCPIIIGMSNLTHARR